MGRIIFASDYEGTYHILDGHPAESEVEAVRKFRREGNLFGIVTNRDGFEAMANMGEYEEEYDFIVCSTGACTIIRLPVEAGKYGAPTRIFTDTANRYFLGELYDLFISVGTSYINADVLGFRGGDGEAKRFRDEYDPALGLGCWAHYWGGGGKYYHNIVNRHALSSVTDFTQCRAVFKNSITAEGVAGEVNRRYNGWLHAYSVGNSAVVLPEGSNKALGVRRFAEFAGFSADDVWTFGDGAEDACMLSAFNGIAMKNAHPSAAAAAATTAGSVEEAIEIALRGNDRR